MDGHRERGQVRAPAEETQQETKGGRGLSRKQMADKSAVKGMSLSANWSLSAGTRGIPECLQHSRNKA